jgi:uncharacterized protein YfaS (alpha-2-macroglobulin family)
MDKRGPLKFGYTISGKSVKANSELPISQVQIPIDGTKKEAVSVINESGGNLYVRLISEGTPARGQEESEQSNLNLTVRYTDRNGRAIDPTNLEQGTQFIAEVSVNHPGIRSRYENMALAQVFPSGWEINNLRLDETQQLISNSSFTYQDIRDDRVYTYFNLSARETKTFRILLTATYAGNYYLPAVSCEAMYDRSIYSRIKGKVVEVIQPAGVE